MSVVDGVLQKEALESLLDESERMFYSDLEENKYLPHLLRAINKARASLGRSTLRLTVEEIN